MAGIPSIGDMIMLSQLAWKIGCAFTSGRSGAPAEFQEVENELTGLTKAITLLTETLDRDDSILARADEKTKDGLDKILECCRQTLENLNALVDQYQEVRRPEGNGSLAIQRVWKPIFIRNYKKIWWTSEGGNIQALRNMLQMHVSSISLTMQALQSKSLTRLENTIEPMADRVAGIHDKFNGDLDVKIAEIHDLMQTMSATDDSATLWSTSKDSPASPGEFWSHGLKKRNPNSDSISKDSFSTYSSSLIDIDKYDFPQTPGRSPELPGTKVSPPPLKLRTEGDVERRRPKSPVQSPVQSPVPPPPRRRPIDDTSPVYGTKWKHHAFGENDIQTAEPYGNPQPNVRDRAELPAEISRPTASYPSSVLSLGRSPSSNSHASPVPSLVMSSSTASYNTHVASVAVSPVEIPLIPPRSSHRPSLSTPYTTPRTSVGTTHHAVSYTQPEPSQRISQPNTVPSELSMRISQNSAHYPPSAPSVEPSSRFPSMLPSPIIPPVQEAQPLHSNSVVSSLMPVHDPVEEESVRAVATDLERTLFERELALDSATLCEANATLVEYTAPDEDNPGEWKMTQAASSCKISVITRMQNYATGSHFVTSIWTMSDDRRIRLQQTLPDGAPVVPYTIWGNNLKVVLRTNAELIYHDVNPNSRPVEVVKTQWVNYIFADETGAALFQSVVMGKFLMLSLKTKRTLRVHDGLSSAFAFQEQLCGLENIRLWQEDSGDVLAMIHYSPSFRDGYLAFQVGASSRRKIHFRGDGERHVKIKGLEVPIDAKREVGRRTDSPPQGGKSPKVKSEKKVTAVRIEFTTEADKRIFLNKLKEVQG